MAQGLMKLWGRSGPKPYMTPTATKSLELLCGAQGLGDPQDTYICNSSCLKTQSHTKL